MCKYTKECSEYEGKICAGLTSLRPSCFEPYVGGKDPRPHPAQSEEPSAGELLKRIPCTKDGKPILWGDTVYIANPDGEPWEDGYVLPLKVESIMIGCHFEVYDGTHTIMGGDNECGNLECYSASELVPADF